MIRPKYMEDRVSEKQRPGPKVLPGSEPEGSIRAGILSPLKICQGDRH